MNSTREKILLLLFSGLAFGYSILPSQRRMVLSRFSKEWKRINNKELKEGIKYLYKLDLIDKIKSKNGFITINITEKGRLRALNRKLIDIKNKKEKWDGKWRIVAFDIPEKYRNGRDALRRKLKSVGFCELQKSVLVAPYNCEEEIKLLVKFFKLEKYVRIGTLESIDNADYLKGIFRF